MNKIFVFLEKCFDLRNADAAQKGKDELSTLSINTNKGYKKSISLVTQGPLWETLLGRGHLILHSYKI